MKKFSANPGFANQISETNPERGERFSDPGQLGATDLAPVRAKFGNLALIPSGSELRG